MTEEFVKGDEYYHAQRGLAVLYDPIHRIVLANGIWSSVDETAMLISDASPPPRAVATRDLSHYYVGGQRLIGMTSSEIVRRYGPAQVTNRACEMSAISYSNKPFIITFVFLHNRLSGIFQFELD